MDVVIEAGLPAIRGLHLVALLSSLGTEAFRLLSYRPLTATPVGSVLLLGIVSYGRIAAILALASGAAWFWLQGGAMLGRSVDGIEAARAIAETHFGGALLLRLGLLGLAIWLLRRNGGARAAVLPLLAVAAFLQGWLGHGASTDMRTTAALGFHVLAAGLWLGSLGPLLATCLVLPTQAPLLARRFTPLGLGCVGVLAVTSIVQTQSLIGTLAGALGTDYGKLALVKLALFCVLLLLAATNRFRLVPLAETGGSTGGLTLSIAVEASVGLATVAVAAMLASQPPAIHEPPVWPFSLRPVPGMWDDSYLRDGLFRLLAPAVIGLGLITLAIMFRKLRWPALFASAVALAYVQMPPWRPYVAAAVPTTFQRSPTGYAARSITAGRELFQSDCASCHGRDGRGRGPQAVARSVWPPDLSAPLIAGRPGGELFWSIRHGLGPMPPATDLNDAAIWSLVDFIRLRAGARAYTASEMRWAGATRIPGFVARCEGGVIITPEHGKPLRLWIEADSRSANVQVQVDGATDRCAVEDPQPLAAALAELTGSASPPAQVLVDANGWMRRSFVTEDDAAHDVVAAELKLIREEPLDGSYLHH